MKIMKERIKKGYLVLLTMAVMAVLVLLQKTAYDAGDSHIFTGDTITAYPGVDSDWIKDGWGWILTGDDGCVLLGAQSYNTCQITALRPGKAHLHWYLNTHTVDKYYNNISDLTDVSYYTRTQNHYCDWDITVTDGVIVNLDANGGEVTPAIFKVEYGKKYGTYKSLPTPKNGYNVFEGWYTKASDGTAVTDDTAVTSEAEHTLYAQWKPMYDYTLHFDGNGAPDGSMADLSTSYGLNVKLPSLGYAWSGHAFKSWNTKPDGTGISFTDWRSLSSLINKQNTEITLYAQWDDRDINSGAWEGFTWQLSADQILTITGEGDMPADIPWAKYKSLIQKVILSDGITSIVNSAFANCYYLTSAEIPDSVTCIGTNAFQNTSLDRVHISKNVASIGEGAFSNDGFTIGLNSDMTGATYVKWIDVDEENPYFKSVDGVLYTRDGTTLLQYPGGKADEDFMIPYGVTTIAPYAMTKTAKSVTFPKSVTLLECNAFHLSNVKTMIFYGNPPALGDDPIDLGDGTTELSWEDGVFTAVTATIYTPSGSSAWTEKKSRFNYSYTYSLDVKPTFTWKTFNKGSGLNVLLSETSFPYTGEEICPAVIVKNLYGYRLYEGQDYSVTYAENVAIGEDIGIIRVVGVGDYAGASKEKTFTITKGKQDPVILNEETAMHNGDTLQVRVDPDTVHGACTFVSSDPSVAEVDTGGLIRAKSAGEVTVTVKTAGDECVEAGESSLKLTVLAGMVHSFEAADGTSDPTVERCNICGRYNLNYQSLDWNVEADELTYSMAAQSPVVTIEGLTEGTDYVVGESQGTDAGTYTVTVTGQGQYAGKRQVEWKIGKAAATYVTEPMGKTGLVYSKEPQELITAGTTYAGSGSACVYSLSEMGTFKEAVPTGIDAGDYTVYYKILGGKNCFDSEVKSLEVSISKATLTMADVPKVPEGLVVRGGSRYSSVYTEKGFTVRGDGDVIISCNPEEELSALDVYYSYCPDEKNYEPLVDVPVSVMVGHNYVDGECTHCGRKHTHEWDAGVVTAEPTCTGVGTRTFTCGKCFDTMTEDIAAKGHVEVTDAAVKATCTKTGLTQGSHCSVCKKVIKAQKVVPATGHKVVIDKAVKATYDKAGKTEGSHCSVCKTTIKKQKVVPKLKRNGWFTVRNKSYYYVNDVKQTGLRTIKNKTYYFDKKTGEMQTGKIKVGKKWYFFSDKKKTKGQMQTGKIKIGKKYYYFSPAKKTSGQMVTGWVKIGKKKFYFSPKKASLGQMVTGKLKIGKKTYKFNKKGECLNP